MRDREFCRYAGVFPVRHFQCAGLIQVCESKCHSVFADGELFCQLFDYKEREGLSRWKDLE